MTAAELAAELLTKPPNYEVMKAGESHLVHEVVTDHEAEKVYLY